MRRVATDNQVALEATMQRFWMVGVLAVGLLGVATPHTHAGYVNTLDRGRFNQAGFHDSGDTYYTAGRTGGTTYRNFFVFDLSGITGPITSAKLRLYNDTSTADGLNFKLSDVSTAINDLFVDHSYNTGIYDDLGTGTEFGVRLITSADNNGKFIEITLNTAAITALNANLGGQIAFGGRLDGAGAEDFVFGPTAGEGPSDTFTQLHFETLVEEVPAPPAVVLGVIGIASLLGVGRFARRKPTPAVA